MHEYRFHFLGEDGRRQRVEVVRAKDDGAALDRARIRHHAHSVEVVSGDRMVGKIPPSGG
jgi:hypothetical protein